MPDQMTTEEFAQSIKKKYPQYASIPDSELADKMLAKYPQYKANIKTAEGPVSRFAGSAAKALLPSTTPSDYLYPIEHPITTAENIPGVLKEMVAQPIRELTAKSDNWQDSALHGLKAVPIVGQNIVEAGEQFNERDIAGGLGTVAGTAAGVEAPEAIGEGLSKVGKLRKGAAEAVRGQVQRSLGAGPGAVVRPAVEEFVGKSKEAAASKELATKSGKLGSALDDLDAKLRTEASEKYDVVRKATANDPGISAGPLADAVRHAEQNILKGSTENIKQFRQLVGEAQEEPGIETSYGTVKPGDVPPKTYPEGGYGRTRPELKGYKAESAYDRMVKQGATGFGGSLPFDELQGYSTELGSKMRSGIKDGDVYQAVKYVKDALDKAKTEVAERNGAGPALKDADTFWSRYQDTFYNKPGAVASVLENVRDEKDLGSQASPFISGEYGEAGVRNLRSLPTRHAAEAKAIADLADELRNTDSKVGVKEPAPPTAASLKESRSEKLRNLGNRPRTYMIYSALGGFLTGHPGFGEIALGGSAVINRFLESDKVVNFLSKPTAGDLKAIEAMPEPQKAALAKDIQAAAGHNASKGIKVDPTLLRAAGITSVGVPKNRQEAMERLGSIQ